MDAAYSLLKDDETKFCSLMQEDECNMHMKERGQFDVVMILRLIMSCLSILGTFSILGSALYRKTVCNPKVHPIFVLSIADTILSLLWVSGALVWLAGGGGKQMHHEVGCFSINLITVILQCVAMNLTLIYSLLAYSSIRQRDFSGLYMVQQRPVYLHVWPPLCSFIAYLIAWYANGETLPIVVIMIPFGVYSVKYRLVQYANNCSCWCLPFFGNMVPRPPLGANDTYLTNLHKFITTYAVVIVTNFLVVFICMVVIYYKIFHRIRRMRKTQEQNETTPLYGATQAMILEGQKDARKRVSLFISVFLLTGVVTCAFAIHCIVYGFHPYYYMKPHIRKRLYILMLFEAIFVPVQGFLNALVYGWTRGDFLSVMSSRRINARPASFAVSHDTVDENNETLVEDDGEEWEGKGVRRTGNSILFLSTSQEAESAPVAGRQGAGAMTPGSPGLLLGGPGDWD